MKRTNGPGFPMVWLMNSVLEFLPVTLPVNCRSVGLGANMGFALRFLQVGKIWSGPGSG